MANKLQALRDRPLVASALAGFDDLQHEMNRMFERFVHRDPFSSIGLPTQLKGFDLTPTVDVAEKDGAYEITAELPGIAEKDVNVKIEDGVLTISGEKKGSADRREEKHPCLRAALWFVPALVQPAGRRRRAESECRIH